MTDPTPHRPKNAPGQASAANQRRRPDPGRYTPEAGMRGLRAPATRSVSLALPR
jgi:hypothetical protein